MSYVYSKYGILYAPGDDLCKWEMKAESLWRYITKATYEINCSIGGPSSNHTFKYLYLTLRSSSRSAD